MPSVTLLNLSLASVVRGIAILRPLQYKHIITLRITWGIIAACWVSIYTDRSWDYGLPQMTNSKILKRVSECN